MSVRQLRYVPRELLVLLAVSVMVQVFWHSIRPGPLADVSELPVPPALGTLRLSTMGEPLVFAKSTMLWLQAHDNQPGVSIPFAELDYGRVIAWLGRILELDPRGQYPLLAAARLYGVIPVPEKQRLMLDFVYRAFLDDPDRRWPWLAHAAIVAKHRLKDLDLALKYARAITEHARGPDVPAWARDMTIVILEDLGELASARILIGGLLESGRVSDPHEIRFLDQKLKELEDPGVRP